MKEFAIIHDTPKGQLLITREPNGYDYIFTIWLRTAYKGEIGLTKIDNRITDEKADIYFERLRDYEVVKKIVNEVLNQEYL